MTVLTPKAIKCNYVDTATAGTNRLGGRVMLLAHVAHSIMLEKAECLCNMDLARMQVRPDAKK